MKRLVALIVAALLSGCATMPVTLEAPHVSLSSLRLLEVSLFEQRFAVNIRIQNPNPVDLPITGMNFQLDINDVELGRGVSNQAVTVPAYGEAVMEISLVSNIARLVDQVRALESGKGQGLSYRLAGGISVANHWGKMPFDYRGEIGQRR